ncbi:ketopantoate reductase family protein [Nocardia sp. NPDC003482]
MTRYVIVGAGAIGATLAAELTERGEDALLLARGAALEHLARQPLWYHTHTASRVIRVPVAALSGDLGLRLGDVLVVTVKTQDLHGVLPALAWQPVRDERGAEAGVAADLIPLVTVQNGLDAERSAARWFTTVIGAVFLISARYTDLGEVRVGGHPHLGSVIIGPASGDRAPSLAEPVAADLRALDLLVREVPDIAPYKATKLLISVTNGVAVLAGPATDKETLSAALISEARTVLDAAGLAYLDRKALILDPTQQHLSDRAGVTAGQSSTWQSFARGAGHEVDYLNGEIVLLARLNGVAAPLNSALQRILGRGSGVELDGLGELLESIVPAA